MKYVHIALALALVGAVANAETSGPPVVVRGEAFPRRVETTVGVAREDQLDPNTGIPVSFEREQPIQTAAEGAAPALQVQLPIPQTAAEATPLQQAINNLRMDAALERSKAEETLRQAGDVGLAALIEWGLYHELPSVRTHSARLLGVWGGQRVLKYLVEAFYSAAFPTIPPYQVQYVATLDQQISNLTGQNFSFPVRRGSQAPEVANKTVLWWTANYEQLPQQLGEPNLDPRHPQFRDLLREVRSLTLRKREFAGASLPPDIMPTPEQTLGERDGLIDLVPRVPGNFGVDRNISTSLTPSVPKVPAPERDAPGEFRRQLYETKIRDRISVP